MATKKITVNKDIKEELVAILKAKTPSLFEREPAPAFSEKNLSELADSIINLLA